MKLTLSDIKSIRESLNYPALLNMIGSSPLSDMDKVAPIKKVLLCLCEPPLESLETTDKHDDIYAALIEHGEIGAARMLLENNFVSNDNTTHLTTGFVKTKQVLEEKIRDVLGKLLLSDKSENEQVWATKKKVKQLLDNKELLQQRPGHVIRQLDPILEELERITEKAQDNIRAELEKLNSSKESKSKDFILALKRVEEYLASVETLPQAHEALSIAKRAKIGKMSSDEIESLYKSNKEGGRLIRPRKDFDGVDANSIEEIISQLSLKESKLVNIKDDHQLLMSIELFKKLRSRENKINTLNVISELERFIGVKKLADGPRDGTVSTYLISFNNPRVPDFRTKLREKTYLIIPFLCNDNNLVNNVHLISQKLPQDAFVIVYYPGKHDKSIKDRNKNRLIPFFDNVDLLRLAECPRVDRDHAFQQIIFPRTSLSVLQPYNDGNGPTDVEMFRGRHDVIEALKRPKGGTVLFSGRMMGKSSILKNIHYSIEVIERVNNPNNRCILISNSGTKLLTDLVSELAKLIPERDRGEFLRKDQSLTPNHTTPARKRGEMTVERLENVRRFLKGKVLDKGIHLTLLLDEADEFARDDATKPRSESLAWVLRDLENENSDNLRVVFAGFQHIHHQVRHMNGAFANWFGLKLIGPLQLDEATSLIREPFEDFGYRFASSASVTRLLEFTGRHPSLIQETCRQLMDRISRRKTSENINEAITIEAGDVESVCRDEHLRDKVMQVLSKNLHDNHKLNLMVYLILYTFAMNRDSNIEPSSFSVSKLRELLYSWFYDKFNNYFDEKSIGTHVQELEALGLLNKEGENYKFMNLTYASMILEDPNFLSKLFSLFDIVLNPSLGAPRDIPTLTIEDFRNLQSIHDSNVNYLVVGLPKTLHSTIAMGITQFHNIKDRTTCCVDNTGNLTTIDQLKLEIGKRMNLNTKLSMSNMLGKSNVKIIVVDKVDALAKGSQLLEFTREIYDRHNIHCIFFGGAKLCRNYIESLIEDHFELITLKRLRPQDLRKWGETLSELSEKPIILDEGTSKELCRITGGYLPIILLFKDFCSKLKAVSEDAIHPNMNNISSFEKTITNQVIENSLLAELTEDEKNILKRLVKFANEERIWRFTVDELGLVFPEEFKFAVSKGMVTETVEVCTMLDLLTETRLQNKTVFELESSSPLNKLWK